jgi:hypothetical protein
MKGESLLLIGQNDARSLHYGPRVVCQHAANGSEVGLAKKRGWQSEQGCKD